MENLVGMSQLCSLDDDALGIISDGLCNPLEPDILMSFSSASHGLWAPTQPVRQQLRADHEAAAALCRKAGMRSCKELREAKMIHWHGYYFTAADLVTLGSLVSVLPVLNMLSLADIPASCYHAPSHPLAPTVHDGVQRLAERLDVGTLPALTALTLSVMHVGDTGASALAAALGRGALPRLRNLSLMGSALGNAGLVALAPALRQLPGLEAIDLGGNPVGDEGISALLAPPLAASAPPPPTVGLAKLKVLILENIQITDAGCAALASVIDNGALPALEQLGLQQEEPWTAASPAAVDAVLQVLVRACHRHHTKAHSECRMCWQYGPTQVSHS